MITFVADYFKDELCGGAELSLASIIDTCPYKYKTIQCKDFNYDLVDEDDFYIFGNFFYLHDMVMKPSRDSKMTTPFNKIVIVSDYPYCAHRSPMMHKFYEKVECNCHNEEKGKLVLNFIRDSKHVFWKSEKQRDNYYQVCPGLSDTPNTILSSTFSDAEIDQMAELRKILKTDYWAIIDSSNSLKGTEINIGMCEVLKRSYKLLGDLPREVFLKELASCKGLLFWPFGNDTCPRVVSEAKLMGLELEIGDNCENKEEWWVNSTISVMEDYLRGRTKEFWRITQNIYEDISSGKTSTRSI